MFVVLQSGKHRLLYQEAHHSCQHQRICPHPSLFHHLIGQNLASYCQDQLTCFHHHHRHHHHRIPLFHLIFKLHEEQLNQILSSLLCCPLWPFSTADYHLTWIGDLVRHFENYVASSARCPSHSFFLQTHPSTKFIDGSLSLHPHLSPKSFSLSYRVYLHPWFLLSISIGFIWTIYHSSGQV